VGAKKTIQKRPERTVFNTGALPRRGRRQDRLRGHLSPYSEAVAARYMHEHRLLPDGSRRVLRTTGRRVSRSTAPPILAGDDWRPMAECVPSVEYVHAAAYAQGARVPHVTVARQGAASRRGAGIRREAIPTTTSWHGSRGRPTGGQLTNMRWLSPARTATAAPLFARRIPSIARRYRRQADAGPPRSPARDARRRTADRTCLALDCLGAPRPRPRAEKARRAGCRQPAHTRIHRARRCAAARPALAVVRVRLVDHRRRQSVAGCLSLTLTIVQNSRFSVTVLGK
jgi:hypothetical protein